MRLTKYVKIKRNSGTSRQDTSTWPVSLLSLIFRSYKRYNFMIRNALLYWLSGRLLVTIEQHGPSMSLKQCLCLLTVEFKSFGGEVSFVDIVEYF